MRICTRAVASASTMALHSASWMFCSHLLNAAAATRFCCCGDLLVFSIVSRRERRPLRNVPHPQTSTSTAAQKADKMSAGEAMQSSRAGDRTRLSWVCAPDVSWRLSLLMFVSPLEATRTKRNSASCNSERRAEHTPHQARTSGRSTDTAAGQRGAVAFYNRGCADVGGEESAISRAALSQGRCCFSMPPLARWCSLRRYILPRPLEAATRVRHQ